MLVRLIMSIVVIIIIVLAAIFLCVLCGLIWWIISTYNLLQNKKGNAEEAFANLDLQFKKRYEDIATVLEILKGKCDDTICQVLRSARDDAMASADKTQQLQNEALIEECLIKLQPILDNDCSVMGENVKEACDILRQDQDLINYNRQFYNAIASDYNLYLASFPGTMLAKICHLSTMPLYIIEEIADSEEEKEDLHSEIKAEVEK